MRRRTNIRLSKAVGFALEGLEYRRLLSSTPWGTQAVLVHQDQAVANYPWITGAGETIAVLDTGVDYNDSLLGGGFGPGYKIEAGYNYINNTGNPMDDDSRGTGVSGLLAAESYTYTDSATGLTAQFQGIAPGVNLVVVAYDNGGFGTGTQDLLEDALNWSRRQPHHLQHRGGQHLQWIWKLRLTLCLANLWHRFGDARRRRCFHRRRLGQ